MSPSLGDRLAARERPGVSPAMYQSWGNLPFMHWEVPVESLRRLMPARLSVDTFGGKAWAGVTPFTLWGVSPVFTRPCRG